MKKILTFLVIVLAIQTSFADVTFLKPKRGSIVGVDTTQGQDKKYEIKFLGEHYCSTDDFDVVRTCDSLSDIHNINYPGQTFWKVEYKYSTPANGNTFRQKKFNFNICYQSDLEPQKTNTALTPASAQLSKIDCDFTAKSLTEKHQIRSIYESDVQILKWKLDPTKSEQQNQLDWQKLQSNCDAIMLPDYNCNDGS